ncbi:MAG: hypothetical protein M3R20_03395 [Pseudomonadota bacterium]|nr:hypothetical protein [Pseudomonadota bacterium]
MREARCKIALVPLAAASGLLLFRDQLAKTIARGHDGLATSLSLRLPCASRAKRAGANSRILCSNMRALLPLAAAMLGIAYNAKARLLAAILGPAILMLEA